jgi:diguanylate cyclase (GGDEF)-like protein
MTGDHDEIMPVVTTDVNRERDELRLALENIMASQQPVALITLDVNKFRDFNLTLGHEMGDAILHHVRNRLRRLLRKDDRLYRIGDDEFAIVLKPVLSRDHAQIAINKLEDLLARPIDVDGDRVTVSASVGAAFFPDSARDANELLRQSQFALYLAKEGSDFHVVYDPQLEGQQDAIRNLAIGLKQALDRNALELKYQPIVEISDSRIAHVEALIRWYDPDKGRISPLQLVRVAEQTGLIRPLTNWVLNTALRECGEFSNLKISVNLSVLNLDDPELVELVKRSLSTWRVAPRRLCLEVTETAMMADPDRNQGVLQELSQLGVELSIDDFGSGYSSLQYLKRLPVHNIKIDREFVSEIGNEDGDTRIVEAVTQLGHSFGLTVIAEGVEDAASLGVLQRLGCDMAQGFHLSRPIPLDALSELLPHQLPAA